MCMPDRPSLPGDDHSALCLYSPAAPSDAPEFSSACSSDCESPSSAMSSAASSWGTLINPDKSPAPLLEQLCLGIAQLMVSFDSSGTTDLTPERLASFYRKVGGNYDSLFLETKSQALSFIYQSVGCFHSLRPSNNPYEPPSVPSLLPLGFLRWQTIQILMDPDEHSRYLQNAVRQWDIVDSNGDIFPKEIPRDAFPSEPDPEMLQWHEGVCRKLEYDFVKRQTHRASPPNFGAFHQYFSSKESQPDDEEYHSPPPRRATSHRHGHYDSDRPSRRRHHHRRLSGDHPSSSARKSDRREQNTSRHDGRKSGASTPRVRSPSPRSHHPRSSRDRDRTSWYGHPLSPGMEDGPVSPHLSDHDPPPYTTNSEPLRHKHRSRHRHLSPPANTSARRHSHDAYMRKPVRDLSPTAPASRRSHESRPQRSTMSHSEAAAKIRREDRSRSRTPKFREFIFDDPVPAPAPDPPQYAQPPPPPRVVPRHRFNLEPEDSRRGSYSAAGSAANSRPGSGGSGSERPRSFSSAGYYHRSSRLTSPTRSSAAKRYIPSVAEDEAYFPPRRPIYD